MVGFKKFIIDNSAQIWTLVSVVVGGIVTYISTSASEHRKNKRQAQRENLEQILIPYCTCLEQTMARIDEIYQKPYELFAEHNFKKWINSLHEPLIYLDAAKRVFLSQSMREKLKNYKVSVDIFSAVLEQECDNCLSEYKKNISFDLERFPNVPTPMLVMPFMDEATNTKVKIAIINKDDLSLINNIADVHFVTNDDPENFQYTSVALNEEIRNTWTKIYCGVMNFSDIKEPDVELACILLDYIEENISYDQELLSSIISETQSANILSGIIDKLSKMQNELVKAIDKITN